MPVLTRLIAEAKVLAGGIPQCSVLGHAWLSVGGRNCGCELGGCSVPVYKCESCDNYDYGENPEANEIREACLVEATDAG